MKITLETLGEIGKFITENTLVYNKPINPRVPIGHYGDPGYWLANVDNVGFVQPSRASNPKWRQPFKQHQPNVRKDKVMRRKAIRVQKIHNDPVDREKFNPNIFAYQSIPSVCNVEECNGMKAYEGFRSIFDAIEDLTGMELVNLVEEVFG